MLWIVLPGVTSTSGGVRYAIGILTVIVVDVIIVAVDIDVVVATPTAVPAPTTTPCGTKRNAHSE
jgi:hypothetical protein